jgi:hypothetical protein
MSKKTIGLVVITLGVVVLVLSLAADAIRIGARAGFGPYQALGAAAGVITLLFGAWLVLRKPSQKK